MHQHILEVLQNEHSENGMAYHFQNVHFEALLEYVDALLMPAQQGPIPFTNVPVCPANDQCIQLRILATGVVVHYFYRKLEISK